jgi:ectoine hydroxylase-related dioxygenase (phytanoyl-CoA dioxygenase family)
MFEKQLEENGYVVIPDVVPKALLNGVVGDITELLDIPDIESSMGMIELYHTQSMWNVRQYSTIHEAFSSILKNKKLWVSIDRVSYKSPKVEPKTYNNGSFIHWDICINQRPRPFELQGVLALTDTDETMGGFQCVPSLYRELDQWISTLPTKKAVSWYCNVVGDEAWEVVTDWERNTVDKLRVLPSREPKKWKIEKVPMKAGDLVIWNSFLPHGNGVNRGTNPRLAQYITMSPEGDDRLREERINCWKESAPPSGWSFPGNPFIPQRKDPTKLTSLGRKLLGVDRW